MKSFAMRIRACAAAVVLTAAATVPATAWAEPMRIAFGDIATVESLHFLVALERAQKMQ